MLLDLGFPWPFSGVVAGARGLPRGRGMTFSPFPLTNRVLRINIFEDDTQKICLLAGGQKFQLCSLAVLTLIWND